MLQLAQTCSNYSKKFVYNLATYRESISHLCNIWLVSFFISECPPIVNDNHKCSFSLVCLVCRRNPNFIKFSLLLRKSESVTISLEKIVCGHFQSQIGKNYDLGDGIDCEKFPIALHKIDGKNYEQFLA